MKHINTAWRTVYKRLSFSLLTISLFFVFLFLDYVLLTKTTNWETFLKDNSRLFVFLAFNISVVNNILIAVTLSFIAYIIEEKRKYTVTPGVSNSAVGIFLSLLSVGCAVCAGFLLPIFGVAASLTAFPFLGLEIKLLSITVLLFSLYELSLRISGVFSRGKEKSSTIRNYYFAGIIAVLLVYLIPRLPYDIKSKIVGFSSKSTSSQKAASSADNVFDEINPEAGYEINATYGDLGQNMVQMGVVDFEKFKSTYEKAGQPLGQEQLDLFTKSSNQKIKIDRLNSYFLLNFFWAVGLGNKSRLLTEGDMTKYGKNQIGSFASTGGWTLAKGDAMNYYGKGDLIPLTKEQEDLVERVASGIYRPCCNNSTAFPDCNHGMALLGVLQLMAKNNATENQMFEAAKYFNAYWFPGNYYDLALYFKNKEGKKFRDIPGQMILGKDYSSASGWQTAKRWLTDQGLVESPPKQGGGCGV